MKISTQTGHACRALGLEDGVALLCDAGYDALDLSLFRMIEDDNIFNTDSYRDAAARIREIAESRGVVFTQAHAPFRFDFGNEEFFRTVAQPRILRSVEIAALVGASAIVVHPLHYKTYCGHEDEMEELSFDYYRTFIPYCEEYGIRVAVENMWQRDPMRKYIVDDVCSRAARLAKMVDSLNAISPCFTACLDLGHTVLVGEAPEDAIRTLGADRLGALHIHDNTYIADTHTIPGLGRMDWTAITDALREIGYRGDFTYEADAFLRGFPNDLLPTAVRFMVDIARYWAAKCE
ncbi:MAG: sugar phosphate isomerase/epimerase [Clostridia bacterium]|nr:sugar phosphate isomerase/epimerase [Clostridia bacterium]